MITIRHTYADGTLIEGSQRGDGAYEVVKPIRGWRYMPSIKRIGIRNSRGNAPNTWAINAAAEALRTAGYEVDVEVSDENPAFADVEAARAERSEERADRLADRAGRVGARADADYQQARQMGAAIPFGQPAMPDHYSYGRDMRYRAKIGRTYDRAFTGMDEAEELARRAGAAEANQRHRESVPATLRRIAKLEAEERGVRRDLAGRVDYVSDGEGGHKLTLVKPGEAYRASLERRAEGLARELAGWREHVAKAEAEGVKVWSRADFAKGDYVRERGRWYQVERVNPKSLSVPSGNNDHLLPVVTRAEVRHAMGPSQWVRKITYDEVRGRKSADEMAAMVASKEMA